MHRFKKTFMVEGGCMNMQAVVVSGLLAVSLWMLFKSIKGLWVEIGQR